MPADDPAPLVDVVRLYLTRARPVDPYERQRRRAAEARRGHGGDPASAGPGPPQHLRRAAAAGAGHRPDPGGRARRRRAWPGRSCGGCWPSSGAGSSRPALSTGPTTSTGADGRDRRALSEPRRRESAATGRAGAPKEIWRGQRRATPPQLLPQGTWMDRLGAMMPATTAEQTGDVLTGIGASAGRVTAVARVLPGPADFASCGPGRCWSPASRPRPGPRCSPEPGRWSPTSEVRSVTARSSPASTASRRCSARRSPPAGSTRAADHRGRRPGPGLSGRPGGCAVTGRPPPAQPLADRWRHRRRGRRRGRRPSCVRRRRRP